MSEYKLNSEVTERFEVTIHLVNGETLNVYGGASDEELGAIYRCLGATDSRIKFPTAKDTMHFLPASSVLRIEAKGAFTYEA